MSAVEVNFDGLIGPTHHYGGLSLGNRASLAHRHAASSPKRAALQGLSKMKKVADMGVRQAFLPPQTRPHWPTLQEAGFTGSPAEILTQAHHDRPELLSIAYSASAMWTANAATVSPGYDCEDGRVHFTPANLQTMPHRRIEAKQTAATLRAIFHDTSHFEVHDPLPATSEFSDEGAANHTRFCRNGDEPGVELFVYGRDQQIAVSDNQFPARQTLAACEAIAKQHQLSPDRCVFARQHPGAIAAGVFHNDVIAVGNQSLHLVHEMAFVNQAAILAELADKFGEGLQQIVISQEALSLEEAVSTYFFNSQLLTRPDGSMVLLCPIECAESPNALRLTEQLVAGDNPIADCQFINLRESMHNGGGPACLRLRVVLTEKELAAVHPTVFLTEARYEELSAWVNRHYRDQLTVDDLADPRLVEEVAIALEELHAMLGF